jgi:hypothetical protein
MTLVDYSVAAFALLNGGRAFAYFPQIIRVYRDPYGADAVSIATWGLFTMVKRLSRARPASAVIHRTILWEPPHRRDRRNRTPALLLASRRPRRSASR